MSEEIPEPNQHDAAPEPEGAEPKEEAPKEKKAKEKKPKAAKGKDKDKDKKGKKANGKGKNSAGGLSVATHPRAGAQVRRAKGWGGLAGFAIAAYLSLKAGVPADQIALRAVLAGIAGYMIAWACTVTVWRHLVLAEIRALSERGDPSGKSSAAGGADDSPTVKPGE